jgi:hypothetical protein
MQSEAEIIVKLDLNTAYAKISLTSQAQLPIVSYDVALRRSECLLTVIIGASGMNTSSMNKATFIYWKRGEGLKRKN